MYPNNLPAILAMLNISNQQIVKEVYEETDELLSEEERESFKVEVSKVDDEYKKFRQDYFNKLLTISFVFLIPLLAGNLLGIFTTGTFKFIGFFLVFVSSVSELILSFIRATCNHHEKIIAKKFRKYQQKRKGERE